MNTEEFCELSIYKMINREGFGHVFDEEFKKHIYELLNEKKYDLAIDEIQKRLQQEFGEDIYEDYDDDDEDEDEDDDDDEDDEDDDDFDELFEIDNAEDKVDNHNDGIGLLGSLSVLGGIISAFDNEPKSMFSEEDLNRYGLDDKEKDLVRRGLQNPWDFEEDDIDDDDDYYGEDYL